MPVAPTAPTTVDLQEFTKFARPLIASGRYSSAGEVLTAAMDALTREADEEAKQAWLIAAIEEGEASGIYEGDVFNDIRVRHGFPARVRG